MNTFLHGFKTITVAFSFLLMMTTSFIANAVNKEVQTSHQFAIIQIADLAHPGAAVVHRHNAKERRHGKANQATPATSTTQPK